MALLDKLFGRKTLSQLSPQELRKEEILLTKQRDKLMKKIETVAADKQRIFQNGAKQKSPELRKALAQEFEMKTQEQLLAARELNVRSKELLTVARLRMVQENRQHGGRGRGRLNVTARDVAKITGWIEDDAVGQDAYLQKLDTMLEVGGETDADALGAAGLSQAGQELMSLWDQLDRGKVKSDQAYDRADQAARRAAEKTD
jgi:hypothetical protein